MALGRVVVSTSIGAEGIDAEHGKEIYYANDAKQFVDSLVDVADNPNNMHSISKNARQFILEQFDRNTNAKKLYSVYESLLD